MKPLDQLLLFLVLAGLSVSAHYAIRYWHKPIGLGVVATIAAILMTISVFLFSDYMGSFRDILVTAIFLAAWLASVSVVAYRFVQDILYNKTINNIFIVARATSVGVLLLGIILLINRMIF